MIRSMHVRIVFSAILLAAAPGFAEDADPMQGLQPIPMDPNARMTARSGAAKQVLPRPAPRVTDPVFALTSPVPIEVCESGNTDGIGTIEREGATPTTLASFDFNDDGLVDIVVGYRAAGGGLIAVLAGTGADNHSSFVETAAILHTPVSPDFLATGDFDNDGHRDVVLGARGDDTLFLMSGNGEGDLDVTSRIALEGGISAMVAGEVNRRDGLAELVVGVDGEDGPAVLVFEGPQGAFLARPERLALDSTATGLALGQIDDGFENDLVIASGTTVSVVPGRDRWLTLDPELRPYAVGPITAKHYDLETPIDAVAIGDFVWESERRIEIAVLLADGMIELIEFRNLQSDETSPAATDQAAWRRVAGARIETAGSPSEARLLLTTRVSRTSMDDLLVLDGANRRAHIFSGSVRNQADARADFAEERITSLSGRPLAALSLRLNGDAARDLVILHEDVTRPSAHLSAPAAIITVNNNGDSTSPGDGNCTLREALINSNSDSDTTAGDCVAGSGADTIAFNLPGGGLGSTILGNSALPVITDPVVIDGASQGCVTPPCITLNGAFAGAGVNGLEMDADGNTVRGLAISNFAASGILIRSSDNIVRGCHIGVDLSGSTATGNGTGITVNNGSDNFIGGPGVGARNVISANTDGVLILGAAGEGNWILGNYLGTDASGTVGLANSSGGVSIDGASNNFVGGTGAGDGNLASANGLAGILVRGGGTGNLVQGNVVGLDVDDLPLGNNNSGTGASDSDSNTFGGTAVGAGNVVSSNTFAGVVLTDFFGGVTPEFNIVQGNLVGTDSTGTIARPSGSGSGGIAVLPGNFNLIGGNVPEARNVAGSDGTGCIWIAGTENVVQGNYAGTDITGTVALNSAGAVTMIIGEAPNATDTTVLDNLISSGNFGTLQLQFTTTGTVVERNLIGTDATGTLDLGSNSRGVILLGTDVQDNTIGSSHVGDGNVIAGHTLSGVRIFEAPGNRIVGNRIGTDRLGAPLPNGLNGVSIENALNNSVGGTGAAEGNTIAFNLFAGVVVEDTGAPATGNDVLGNSIFGNGALGIDLADDGVTPNDLGDPDPGANLLQNFPVLTSAEVGLSSTTIKGSLNSIGGTFRVEFFTAPSCDPSGHGEGEQFIGATNVTTNIMGNATFETTVLMPAVVGGVVTSTATFASGTSEFSQCFMATSCASLTPFGQTVRAPNKDELAWPAPADILSVRGLLADVSDYDTFGGGPAAAATSIDISIDDPSAGSGVWYLVRPLACGSWQTAPGEEPGRDAGALP